MRHDPVRSTELLLSIMFKQHRHINGRDTRPNVEGHRAPVACIHGSTLEPIGDVLGWLAGIRNGSLVECPHYLPPDEPIYFRKIDGLFVREDGCVN